MIADVLRAARDEADEEGRVRISVILRKANMSYSRLSSLLDELIGSGLLVEVEVEDGKGYTITEIGIRFLEEFERLEKFAKAYGLRL